MNLGEEKRKEILNKNIQMLGAGGDALRPSLPLLFPRCWKCSKVSLKAEHYTINGLLV